MRYSRCTVMLVLAALWACDAPAPSEPGVAGAPSFAKGGSCQPEEAKCQGSCTNLQTDFYNCGSCGNVCGAGEVCDAGSCMQASCGCSDVGLTGCQGSCTNLMTDESNCGQCGVACYPGQVCNTGTCVLSCPLGQLAWQGTCIDPLTDEAHCGATPTFPGFQCGLGEQCSSGVCEPSSSCGCTDLGLTECQGSCTNLLTDPGNCGQCGIACYPGQVCNAGTCVLSCPIGLVACAGTCIDPATDERYCGATGGCGATGNGTPGYVCGNGEVCSLGSCVSACQG